MSKDYIKAKRITIETDEEKIVYDLDAIQTVFKSKPDSRGRLHLGTKNRVVVIELGTQKKE